MYNVIMNKLYIAYAKSIEALYINRNDFKYTSRHTIIITRMLMR